MSRLFIAEKPELAKAIAAQVSNSYTRNDGFFDCSNGDKVTWCFGHMLKLSDPEDYDSKYAKWNMNDLPFCHVPWTKKISDDKKKQVNIIKGLVKNAQAVVNAGDPDDEGQLLVDELLEFFGNNKPVYRVLVNDYTPAIVKRALDSIESNNKYEHLGFQAEARSVADQLFGYNLTRGYTLQAGSDNVLSVGRVQTPILGLVVRRYREFNSHKKSYYYSVKGLFDFGVKFHGNYLIKDNDPVDDKKRIIDQTFAESVKNDIHEKQASLISVETEKKKTNAPLPYNLLTLQSDASRKFGYKPDQVKAITQELREKYQLITYNRSDCEYLNEEMHNDAPAVLSAISQNASVFKTVILNSNSSLKSRAFNSDKVSAHHAIIPTQSNYDVSTLKEELKNVYFLIARAYIAQFYPKYEFDETTVLIECAGHQFKSICNVPTSLGWKVLYKNDVGNDDIADNPEAQNLDLRALQSGSTGQCIEGISEQKETKPAPLYTIATLLKDLTRAAKYIKDPKLKKILVEKDKDKASDHGSIGTPATRDSIIATLFNRGFLVEKGKNIIPTATGEKLYDALPDTIKYPDMTAIWHDQIKEIRQKDEVKNFISNLMEFIESEISQVKQKQLNVVDKSHKCPKCQDGYLKRINRGKKPFWGCSNYPNCDHTQPDSKGKPGVVTNKPKPELSNFECKTCSSKLVFRQGKNKTTKKDYKFWSCSAYPNCKTTYFDNNGAPKYE
ncbi:MULTISPECIES: DNA topoisomerase 3 [unclassified Acinetobacter]|uniref:DNA topoisomerase 3 n=1 Tax=unclassified Acinetobacter TaxID=196816 RepID=UPI0015D3B114|nr:MULTISPECIES: DNA topoisomerase 3 [unclassified Acinetobacter]UUS62548.1 DNA topoisomerase 3 [Acinetobacter sp. YH16056_T]